MSEQEPPDVENISCPTKWAEITGVVVGVGVFVGVIVGVAVIVGVTVGVDVLVGVLVGLTLGVTVGVAVNVGVGVGVIKTNSPYSQPWVSIILIRILPLVYGAET